MTLDQAQVDRLGAIFGLMGDELRELLLELAAAALAEYALAFSGTRSPSTMREVRELRLKLLYQHLSGNRPGDDEVAQLFQLTPAAAGTLIANTRARFDAEMGARARDAAVAALEQATFVDDDTVRVTIPDSMARYLRELVARTSAPPLDKRKDASRTYDVSRPTVVALCGLLGVPAERVEALDW